jgi:parallel beta-helix repeat protein
LRRLLAALPSGATGCVTRGSVFDEQITIARTVTLRSPEGPATIVGQVTIGQSAPRTVISGLEIRGTGGGRAAVVVLGDKAQILGNEVTGVGFENRSTPCVLLDGVHSVVVDANRIHNCTRATTRNLYSPGILVASSLRSRITNNVVFHTLGDGIALGPNAQRTVVSRNLVDSNVSGILIAGDARTASSYNVVTRNIVSNSGRFNIHATWGGAVGTGNVVSSNCLWNGFGANFAGSGFASSGTIIANPRLVGLSHSYAIANGPCFAMRPSIVRAHLSVLPRFTVSYRLTVLPAQVRVVSLLLSGLRPGVVVRVSCAHGCSAHWSGRARRSTLLLPVLGGASLARGSIVEVFATQNGYVGAYARVIVTGLPLGVRIEHACLAPGSSRPVSCGQFR